MFCTSGLVFDGMEGVGCHFHVLRSRTHFGRYIGRQVPFSSFALSDSFEVVPRVSYPVFKFCAPRHVFDGTEGVGSHFYVLRSRSLFVPYRGRRVIFSCLALLDFFSAVPRASGPIFMFALPNLFWAYRGRRVPFSCYAHLDSFWAVLSAPGSVFMFCALGLIFDGTEGVGSRCHVLRCQTRFRWYRGRWVQFLFFALPGSFWAVPRV
jgi:hypothetical protein